MKSSAARITLALAAVSLCVSACVPSDFIVLKNPQTGEIKECKAPPGSGASLMPNIQTTIDNAATQSCAKGYEAAGYVRMN